MTNTTQNQFGGPWTQEKLGILKKYLDAYTTALKNQQFCLLYIDAFAGAGTVEQGILIKTTVVYSLTGQPELL